MDSAIAGEEIHQSEPSTAARAEGVAHLRQPPLPRSRAPHLLRRPRRDLRPYLHAQVRAEDRRRDHLAGDSEGGAQGPGHHLR